ncbi:hypothetical protein AB4144_02395 [Rhizobiaceae sp. 2RAB30]
MGSCPIDDFDNLAYGLPQFAIFVGDYALQFPLNFRHRAYTLPYLRSVIATEKERIARQWQR